MKVFFGPLSSMHVKRVFGKSPNLGVGFQLCRLVVLLPQKILLPGGIERAIGEDCWRDSECTAPVLVFATPPNVECGALLKRTRGKPGDLLQELSCIAFAGASFNNSHCVPCCNMHLYVHTHVAPQLTMQVLFLLSWLHVSGLQALKGWVSPKMLGNLFEPWLVLVRRMGSSPVPGKTNRCNAR